MSYRVKIENFEGPFDLLLYLVSRQKVDIGEISITEITDQYLAEIQRMKNVDLDIASDFLLVAATLLELKAASLVAGDDDVPEELEDLSPYEMREALIAHLFEYKKFKNAAAALQGRYEAEGRMYVRTCGPDRSLLTVIPDYLESITPDNLAAVAARVFSRKDVFLLESEHIAAHVIPVEQQIQTLYERVKANKRVSFSEIVANSDSAALVVVTFLAVLELYKRSMVSLSQSELFGDITISYREDAPELDLSEEQFDSSEE